MAKKSTKVEYERRVAAVVRMMLQGYVGSRIVQNASETWGITNRQAHNYAKDAREKIQEMSDGLLSDAIGHFLLSYEELRAQSADEEFKRQILKDEVEMLGLKKHSPLLLTMNLDMGEMSDDELSRISDGENPLDVLAETRKS